MPWIIQFLNVCGLKKKKKTKAKNKPVLYSYLEEGPVLGKASVFHM